MSRSRPSTELRVPLVPHKTRVVVRGQGAGVVLSVQNVRRRLLGIGSRMDVPATVTVILDSGRRVVELVSAVEVESSRPQRAAVSEPRSSLGSLTSDPGDECDQECCAS